MTAKTVARLDAFQKRHSALAVPLAVIKKYDEDRGNNHVAVLTYYAFLSLFPLLLLFVTILEVSMSHYPAFRDEVLDSTLNSFPILSGTLAENVHGLSGAWPRVLFSGILALLAGIGVADAVRNTIADLWHIPRAKRRGAPKTYAQNIGLLAVGGLILGATTLVASGLVGKGNIGFYLVALAINFGLFLTVYRIATPRQIRTKHLLVQSAITAVAWQVLQAIGALLVQNQLDNLNALYGSFAVVLGLLFWLYFVARIAVYAVELEVVLTRKLWPRSLGSALTPPDKAALGAVAATAQLHEQEEIAVTFRAK